MENDPDGERQEMIELYTSKGMSKEDAETIVLTYSRYDDLFVDLMMRVELEIMPPETGDNPAKGGA